MGIILFTLLNDLEFPYFARLWLAETACLLECTSEWIDRKQRLAVYSGFLFLATR